MMNLHSLSASHVRLPSPEEIQQELARRATERERQRIAENYEAIRNKCQSLSGFIEEGWHVLEPNKLFVPNWHIDLICDHLEAITHGKFLEMGLPNRLLVNVPPGTMKSLIISVFWPAWEWGPMRLPSMRFINTSYSDTYVVRDSRRMRDLVMSPWFQALWGDHVELKRSGERSFSNTRTGSRDGVPFGSLTGGRGDRLVIDDPHSTETAESDAERRRTVRIFLESVPLRVNDARESAIIVVMQRLHPKDVSGIIKEKKLDYIHLNLPMEFEADNRCVTPLGEDPRTEEGELLFSERFPRDVVERDKKSLGSYGTAGQFQQRPAPREGGLFKRHWFADRIVGAAPRGLTEVRHWDLASTKKSNSPRTAGVRMGRAGDGTFYVTHVVATREEGSAVPALIKGTAELDGKGVHVSLPQDPGQAGRVQAQALVKMLAGWRVKAAPESGDKWSRAQPFADQCEAGNVYLVAGDWNEDYIDELCEAGGLMDQIDASSGAFGYLLEHTNYSLDNVG